MLKDMTDTGHLTYHCSKCQQPYTHHVSHEAIQYHPGDPTMIAMPVCSCGRQDSLKVVQPQWELHPPIITYAPDGSISDVLIQGATNKIVIHEHAERHMLPDGKGGVQEVFTRVIDGVTWPLPWVGHHQNLIKHMEAQGKTVPDHVNTPLEAMIPMSHVKELVYGILKQHGIDPLEDTGKQQAIQTGNVGTPPDQG